MSAVPAALTGRLGVAERVVLEAVGAAGQLLLDAQAAIVADPTAVSWKLDLTPVTVADHASEALISAAIEQVSEPGYRLVAEEGLPCPTIQSEVSWFVDPLDGTRAYRSGAADFAILVSRWQVGRGRFSVAHYPAFGQWLVTADGTVMTAGPTVEPPVSVEAVCLCYLDDRARTIFADGLDDVSIRIDEQSTRALFELALGRLRAVAVQVHALKSWDIAPLVHAVEASGGYICDQAGDRIVLYQAALSARFILAARTEQQLRQLQRLAARY